MHDVEMVVRHLEVGFMIRHPEWVGKLMKAPSPLEDLMQMWWKQVGQVTMQGRLRCSLDELCASCIKLQGCM